MFFPQNNCWILACIKTNKRVSSMGDGFLDTCDIITLYNYNLIVELNK